MSFTSVQFFIFFPIVVAVYFIVPKKLRYIWLLIASYYFYMGWSAKYAILIAASTFITYLSGILMARAEDKFTLNNPDKEAFNYEAESHKLIRLKKWIVAGSFIINLGILAFFKYFYFALGNVNFILRHLNFAEVSTDLNIVLPVGISFYTFQALGYTVDVYRGDIKAEKNLLKYALFVSFFPQLVAGPIERSKNLLQQVNHADEIKVWNYERIVKGLIMMLWGYFMKMVIADRAAVLVDMVYNNYYTYGSIEIILATALFGIQVYCDFGSYSMIAIGAANVMGFTLMENFRAPYFSTSIKDYWSRWHLSFSNWLKDYIYIPLGGSRCSRLRHCFNILVVFFVSGIWHGASWAFITWGMLHGIYQIIDIYTHKYRDKLKDKLGVRRDVLSHRIGQILITLTLLNVTHIFFRADRVSQGIDMLKRVFTRWDPWVLFDKSLYSLGLDQTEFGLLILAIIILFLVDLIREVKGVTIDIYLVEQNLWFRWAAIFILFFGILIYGMYGPDFYAADFIYFQF